MLLESVAEWRGMRTTQQDFNLILTHYGLERLLYRLSVSAHAPNFLLKGALLFSLWYDLPHRPSGASVFSVGSSSTGMAG